MNIWLPVRQLILEQINDYNLNEFNLFTILSGAYEYRLVQATENGRPRELMTKWFIGPIKYYLNVTVSRQGEPISFDTQVFNFLSCPHLQPAGLEQWKAVYHSCMTTYKAGPEDERFYFSILTRGILTISDDFKNLTFTRSDNDRNGTLLFELKDFNEFDL